MQTKKIQQGCYYLNSLQYIVFCYFGVIDLVCHAGAELPKATCYVFALIFFFFLLYFVKKTAIKMSLSFSFMLL